jgi:hypothetical protein
MDTGIGKNGWINTKKFKMDSTYFSGPSGFSVGKAEQK